MGKVSVEDKMNIQTLREQGLGYRAIVERTNQLETFIPRFNITVVHSHLFVHSHTRIYR